jgi:hypothetical protein
LRLKKKNNYSLIHYLLLNRLFRKIKMINQKMIIRIVKNGQMMINMSQRKKKKQKKIKMINIIRIRSFLQKEENMESREILMM